MTMSKKKELRAELLRAQIILDFLHSMLCGGMGQKLNPEQMLDYAANLFSEFEFEVAGVNFNRREKKDL